MHDYGVLADTMKMFSYKYIDMPTVRVEDPSESA